MKVFNYMLFFFLTANSFLVSKSSFEEKSETLRKNKNPTLNRYSKGGDISLGFDSYRGIPSGSWSGSTGGILSLGFWGGIEDEDFKNCIGIGGSYGLYDFDGRGLSIATSRYALQQQGFVTGEIFLGTAKPTGLQVTLDYDVMITDNFGLFALHPIIDQFRLKIGCLIFGKDIIGVWGTHYVMNYHQKVSEIPIEFRALPQGNIFWTHYFENNSHLTFWGGTPYTKSLMYGNGRPGNYIFGVDFRAHLTKNWSIKGFGSYMGSRGNNPLQKASNYASNVGFALTYSFFGEDSRSHIDIANNSNFLVDTNMNL